MANRTNPGWPFKISFTEIYCDWRHSSRNNGPLRFKCHNWPFSYSSKTRIFSIFRFPLLCNFCVICINTNFLFPSQFNFRLPRQQKQPPSRRPPSCTAKTWANTMRSMWTSYWRSCPPRKSKSWPRRSIQMWVENQKRISWSVLNPFFLYSRTTSCHPTSATTTIAKRKPLDRWTGRSWLSTLTNRHWKRPMNQSWNLLSREKSVARRWVGITRNQSSLMGNCQNLFYTSNSIQNPPNEV